MSGGNQFFANYTGVLSQLISNALTNFQSVLGSYYPMWQRYLAGLKPDAVAAATAQHLLHVGDHHLHQKNHSSRRQQTTHLLQGELVTDEPLLV